MDIEVYEKLTVGSIVEIEGVFYILNELPSCVYYESKPEWRLYLHSLNGKSYYNYPYPLEEIERQIKEKKGKIYSKDAYKLQIVGK